MCTIIFNFTAGNYKQSQNTKKQESHAIISTLLPIENLCFYTTRTTYKFMLLYHQDNIQILHIYYMPNLFEKHPQIFRGGWYRSEILRVVKLN